MRAKLAKIRDLALRWWLAFGAVAYAVAEFFLHLFRIPHWH